MKNNQILEFYKRNPIIILFAVIGVLFVLFRMKAVELDYQYTVLLKDIETKNFKIKELQAQKAKMLAPARLKKLAKKYNLNSPEQKQIIVVP